MAKLHAESTKHHMFFSESVVANYQEVLTYFLTSKEVMHISRLGTYILTNNLHHQVNMYARIVSESSQLKMMVCHDVT